MPYLQMGETTGSIQAIQVHGDTSRSSSFVEVTPPTSYSGSPIEASGDIPHRQAPCIVEQISASVESFARSRILAVTALNIFVYDRTLNAHCDRWICPFSNCKRSFSDPKAMMSHAAICTHVSADGAYCNCCCSYYDFPGQGPAHPTVHGDSAPPAVKSSAMTKGKKKIINLISRYAGSASSSREQLSTLSSPKACSSFGIEFPSDSTLASRKESMVSDLSMTGLLTDHPPRAGAAELCADDEIVEIDTFGAFQNSLVFLSNTDSHAQQPPARSTASTLSTIGYAEPMGTGYGDVCMSPTEYSTPDVYNDTTQRSYNGSVSYATDESSCHHAQHSEVTPQSFSWDVDSQQVEAQWNSSGQSATPPQSTPGLIVNVPNFSLPFHVSPSEYTGETSGSGTRHPSGQVDALQQVVAQSQYEFGEGFDFSNYQPPGYAPTEAGIGSHNLQQFDITEGPAATALISPRESPGSSSFSWNGDAGIRCLECDYQPEGAEGTKRTRLRRHIQNIHLSTDVWPCHRCGYPFNRRDNLVAHLEGVVCEKGKTRQRSTYRRRNQGGRPRQTW